MATASSSYDIVVYNIYITSDCDDCIIDSSKYYDRVMMIMITIHIYYISH